MRNFKTASLCAAAVAAASLFAPAQDATAEGWEWMVAPYVWGIAPELDFYANGNEIINAEMDFSDILDNIDFAMQVHAEGRKGALGLFTDVTFLNLGDDKEINGRLIIPDGTTLRTDTKLTQVELGGFYRPSAAEYGFDILAGARITDMDVDLDITFPQIGTSSVGGSETYTDGFAGVRYSTPFADKWLMVIRGDVGAGDSEIAWNGVLTLGRTFGKNNNKSFLFGYRYLYMELDGTSDGGIDTEVDLTIAGPQIGVAFAF